ncbi:hypothetical protein SAMN04490182_3485 [Pseudomonas cedrina]|uniref:Uncharacterized protein n=1 Tax=Pseudomonas cedrina TaxID=651740 RepID=A0ABY0UTW3_PSECE|nr:hypothetical protein SAMN04490182_3485 [Pseudomonas cedrina]
MTLDLAGFHCKKAADFQHTIRFKKVTGNEIGRKQSSTVHSYTGGSHRRRAGPCRCHLHNRKRLILPGKHCIHLVTASGSALHSAAVQSVTRIAGGNGGCHGAVFVSFPPLGHRLHGLAFLPIQLSRHPHRGIAWRCFQPLAQGTQGAGRVRMGGSRDSGKFGGSRYYDHLRFSRRWAIMCADRRLAAMSS